MRTPPHWHEDWREPRKVFELHCGYILNSTISRTEIEGFGYNRNDLISVRFVSVWAQSIYLKESNRASQKRPPSSWNQIICFLRAISLPSLGNVFLYCGGQVVDFSALWVKIWALRFPAWLNDFLHWAQEWGFSPVCVSMCFLRVPASPKDLLHAAHLCSFSPVWITKCLFKS